MPILGLTKEEEREATARLMSLLLGGYVDDEARELMGLDVLQYEAVKAKMFEEEADKIRQKPSEHVYIEYLLNQLSCVKDLSTMTESFRKTKQYNAMVGAVKARSEIYDKLIKRGQELGLIDKEPEKIQNIDGGAAIVNLTNIELKKTIVAEIQGVQRLMQAYGEKGIGDLEAGELHRSIEAPKRVKSKDPAGRSTRRQKVHKGRRVVKSGK